MPTPKHAARRAEQTPILLFVEWSSILDQAEEMNPVVSKHENEFFAAQRRAADSAEVAEKKAAVKEVMDEQGRLLDRADKIANRIYRAQVESIADVITKLRVLIHQEEDIHPAVRTCLRNLRQLSRK
jgi:predicted ATP-dependent Lon-type protease